MTNFEVSIIDWIAPSDGTEDEWSIAQLKITAGKNILTRVEDRHSKSTRDHIRASASTLSRWIVDNYWRLRFEPLPESQGFPTVDWTIAHSLNAAGGGYVWPHAVFVPNGRSIEIMSVSDRSDPSFPIEFLAAAGSQFVDPSVFERAIDDFVDATVERVRSRRDSDLEEAWNTLREERSSAGIAYFRELEARLGFGIGEAPEDQVMRWSGLIEQYGDTAINEIASAHLDFDTAKAAAETVERSNVFLELGALEGLRESARQSVATASGAAWRVARPLAMKAREILGVSGGPLPNEILVSTLGTNPAADILTDRAPFAVALNEANIVKLAYHAKFETGRRFELGRMIGDWLAFDDALRPSLRSKTWRQQFQKAFSQTLFAPIEVVDSLRPASSDWDEDSLESAAKILNVSTLLIDATLRNNKRLPRNTDSIGMDLAS